MRWGWDWAEKQDMGVGEKGIVLLISDFSETATKSKQKSVIVDSSPNRKKEVLIHVLDSHKEAAGLLLWKFECAQFIF